jgi:hypothetical protein
MKAEDYVFCFLDKVGRAMTISDNSQRLSATHVCSNENNGKK